MSKHTNRTFHAATDTDACARILSIAFGGKEDDSRRWLDEIGSVSRVHVEGGDILGTLCLLQMGQWFGGRSVPMWGVAGVATSPEDRGRGVGTRLMQDAVVEMHEKGIALSTLFPAAQPVYRRAGYERAGHIYVVEADLGKIAPVDRSARLRRGRPDDEPVLERLEAERAAANDGNLDRDAIMRERARKRHNVLTETHVVEEGGVVTGYLRVRHIRPKGPRRLALSDVVASTPAAARRQLAFLADHATQIEKAGWLGHPTEPLQMAADSICFDVKVEGWMARVTHVESALTARGYPAGMTAEVHLDVDDDICSGNAGRWLLRVAGGCGTVERGGEGRIGLHVRELASIYTGYVAPTALRAARRVTGSDGDLRALGAIFAGGSPWMQDAF